MTVPSRPGAWVAYTCSGILYWRTGSTQRGCKHLGAVARDFLRLIVMQGAQQPRGRDGARIGAEHAGHVGPDLKPRGLELGGEIRARGIRAAAPEQHGVAGGVGGDESLRDDRPARARATRLQRRIRREIAGRRQQARLDVGARGAAPRAAPCAHRPRRCGCPARSGMSRPTAVASNSPIAMTRARCRSLQAARLRPAAPARRLSSAMKALEARARRDPQLRGEIPMQRLDACERRRHGRRPARRPAGTRADR